ncbi:hypothetical protein [Acidovorax soli]|nr:hypothetical protein [Acidovorax soli]
MEKTEKQEIAATQQSCRSRCMGASGSSPERFYVLLCGHQPTPFQR